MTPQELKNSILQLAIQGKLVEQRPEEGTARELFVQIQAEKQRLIEAGKIKKEKPLPEIAEDEKPFEIPEGWMWCRLDDVVAKTIKRGKSPVYTSKSNVLVFAQKCNTKAGYIELSLAQYLDETKLSKYPEEEFMCDNDIVLNSTGNGTLGRVGIYHSCDNPNGHPIVPDSHVTIIRANSFICVEFAFYLLKYYQPYMEKLGSGSTNQTELSAGIVKALLFPLPPLAEQKRIVAKIEELLPYIDRYEQAWSKLEQFNSRFPEDMKKALLQYAIQGELVEQRPEEGTGEELFAQIQAEKQRLIQAGKIKKEKPLPEIAEDEKSFEIPESWKWVRVDDIVVKTIKRGKSPTYTAKSNILVFAQKCNTKAGNIDLSLAQYLDETKIGKYPEEEFMLNNDIVLNSTGNGTLGRVGIYHYSDNPNGYLVVPDSHVTVIRASNYISVKFVFYCLKYYQPHMEKLGSGSTNQTELSAEIVKALLFPLPPLAEQKRIVEKLEQLLPLCGCLK